jgi:hypothetical protein
MASLGQLKTDVMLWLNRQDVDASNAFQTWVTLTELELAQTLRARCVVKSAYQMIDADYIPLPADFATLQVVRDARTGEMLVLKDQWTGHWQDVPDDSNWPSNIPTVGTPSPCWAYRLSGNCIEFLPHPSPHFPDPPDPAFQFQQVLVSWYAKPVPLLALTDSNVVLEQLYAVYLYGVIKHGAIWAQDDARAQQADALFKGAVTSADLHTQQADYSGAPLTLEIPLVF